MTTVMSAPWASSPDLAVEGSARAVHGLRAERWRAITSPPAVFSPSAVFPGQGFPPTPFFPEIFTAPHGPCAPHDNVRSGSGPGPGTGRSPGPGVTRSAGAAPERSCERPGRLGVSRRRHHRRGQQHENCERGKTEGNARHDDSLWTLVLDGDSARSWQKSAITQVICYYLCSDAGPSSAGRILSSGDSGGADGFFRAGDGGEKQRQYGHDNLDPIGMSTICSGQR
ncbi:MAG: hypothetical protein QG608_1192 [Actinomycetota bacterium]|nr:hypothetical protein [Actinomycetota bacterium]